PPHTLSLHDALPICARAVRRRGVERIHACNDHLCGAVRRRERDRGGHDPRLQRPRSCWHISKLSDRLEIVVLMATIVSLTADSRAHVADGPSLAEQYRAVRAYTERLCDPLETEDYV